MATSLRAAIFIYAPFPQLAFAFAFAEPIIKPPISSKKAINMAVTSLIVSALTLPTLFLMITVFIFPAIAFFIGMSAFVKACRNPAISLGVKTLALASVWVSMGTFIGCIYLINTGYRT